MIQISKLSFGYTEKPLYQDVNVSINSGQKVGIVGPNGSGKSTLLSIIMGEETNYLGKISVTGKISHVPQEIKHDPIMENSNSARDYVNPDGVYEDHELLRMFKGLQLDIKLDVNPKVLSGGQKTKLALSRALLQKPDILLLDEPTNFMDVQGKKWVMDFLSNYSGTVIVISHDLDLMDKSINKIVSISPYNSKVEEYKGNYTTYLKLKKEKELELKKQIVVKQKHIKRMEEGLRKMSRFTSKKGVKKRVQQQRRIEKERELLPELPPDVKSIKVSLPDPARVGEMPLKVTEVSKSYFDKVVLSGASMTVIRGEKVVFVGQNGVGKSTLIKIIMGLIKPDSGMVYKNENLKIGYYSQEFETFDFNKSVIDTFCEETKKDIDFARNFLGRFMLGGNKIYQKVESLSGGEKTRLSIACLTGKDNNFLILDEPTTYLDVMSQRVILESLKEYKGTMILVSHSPEFVKEMKPTKAYLFPEQRVTYWDDELLGKLSEV